MKYYKITLRKVNPNAQYQYPDNYQIEIGNYARDYLYYQNDVGDNLLLLCIEEKDANNIVRDHVEELTEAEAKQISEDNEVRLEQVTDEAKIRRLTIKSNLGQALTAKELKAIDPDDPEPGIERRKILADRVADLKAKEILRKAK